jgi:molybdopterin molybdotransferase
VEETMISYEDALKVIMGAINTLGVERISINRAYGRVVAENILAQNDLPPFDNSAMDGYAVVSESVKGATLEKPVKLKFIGDIPTGEDRTMRIKQGEAVRIGTGGKIPDGADSIVIVEDTELRGGEVYVFSETSPGRHIRLRGEDFKKGDEGIKKGDLVGPAEICFLAANGITEVEVYRKPRVGIVSTGNELVPPERGISGAIIRDSNSITIHTLVEKYGGSPEVLGILPDDENEIVSFFERNVREFDLFITIGGISMGAHDYVKSALEKIGAHMEFWKVAIRPGKPFGFGKFHDTLVFALPGNPVSSFITFEVFVQPALMKAAGCKPPFREYIGAVIDNDFFKKKGVTYFSRGTLNGDFPDYSFSILKKQGSGMISSMLFSNAVMIAPAEKEKISSGEKVKVFRI